MIRAKIIGNYNKITTGIIIFYFLLLFSISTKADELYKFANILCSKELNFFQINSINLYDVYDDDKDAIQHSAYMASKYNIFYGNVTKECDVNNKHFEFLITYDEPRASGLCGDDNRGHLTVKIDNKVFLKDIPFNVACGDLNVTNVIYQLGYFTLCGNTSPQLGVYQGFCVNVNDTVKDAVDYSFLEEKIKKELSY